MTPLDGSGSRASTLHLFNTKLPQASGRVTHNEKKRRKKGIRSVVTKSTTVARQTPSVLETSHAMEPSVRFRSDLFVRTVEMASAFEQARFIKVAQTHFGATHMQWRVRPGSAAQPLRIKLPVHRLHLHPLNAHPLLHDCLSEPDLEL